MEWVYEVAGEYSLDPIAWSYFTSLDVDHFHIKIRSAFDYLGTVIRSQALVLGQVREGSFEKLCNWVEKDPKRAQKKLGETMTQVVLDSTELFRRQRTVRNALVHRGAKTYVSAPSGGIYFQVFARGFQDPLLDDLGSIMRNNSFVDFRAYALYTLTSFWKYAEAVASYCFTNERLIQVGLGDGSMSYHSGLDVLLSWAKEYRY